MIMIENDTLQASICLFCHYTPVKKFALSDALIIMSFGFFSQVYFKGQMPERFKQNERDATQVCSFLTNCKPVQCTTTVLYNTSRLPNVLQSARIYRMYILYFFSFIWDL